jgi:hypothetical protein
MVRVLVSSRKIDRREGQKLLEKGLHKLAENKANLQSQLEKIFRRMMPLVDTHFESEVVDLDGDLGEPDQMDPASTGCGGRSNDGKKASR